MHAVVILLMCLTAWSTPAWPLVGELDTGQRYPYAVHVTFLNQNAGSYCSAVALSPALVAFNAHCVRSRNQWHANFAVNFVHKDGTERRVPGTVYLPPEYMQLSKILEDFNASISQTGPRVMPENVQRAKAALKAYDIAFIIPKERVDVARYPKTILDEAYPLRAALFKAAHGVGAWTPEVRAAVYKALVETFLTHFASTAGVQVGFGGYDCLPQNDHECLHDKRRRFARSPQIESYRNATVGSEYVFGYTFKADANRAGRGGDSGGPFVFTDAKTGDDVVVGVYAQAPDFFDYAPSFVETVFTQLYLEQSEEYLRVLASPPTPLTSANRAPPDEVGAIAAGIGSKGNLFGAVVRIRKAFSQADADSLALKACREELPRDCTLVARFGFPHGHRCLHVSIGRHTNGTYRYVVDRTLALAKKRCEQGGFICNSETGGCVEMP